MISSNVFLLSSLLSRLCDLSTADMSSLQRVQLDLGHLQDATTHQRGRAPKHTPEAFVGLPRYLFLYAFVVPLQKSPLYVFAMLKAALVCALVLTQKTIFFASLTHLDDLRLPGLLFIMPISWLSIE